MTIGSSTLRAVNRLLLPATLAGLATGCAQFNERNTIGQSTQINPINQTGQAPAIDMTDDATSISSLDRSSWQKTQFLVPVDGAGHQPTGRHDYREVVFTNRQKGIYPTPESSMDLDGKPGREILGEEIAETGGAPLVAMLDVISMPFRLVFDPPTRLKRSPSWNYERSPTHAAPAPAALPEAPASEQTPGAPAAAATPAPAPAGGS